MSARQKAQLRLSLRAAAGWLNATGAPIATRQKLMRHSTITMTMDTYGTVFDEEMSAASARVARLAFHGDRAQNGAQSR